VFVFNIYVNGTQSHYNSRLRSVVEIVFSGSLRESVLVLRPVDERLTTTGFLCGVHGVLLLSEKVEFF
jgi:hypothetical protein